MIDGVKIKIGDTEYTVPPLNFKALKSLKDDIFFVKDNMDGFLDEKQMETVIKVIHAAFTRNYPDMKIEEIEELMDLGNIKIIFPAIMGASGFVGVEKKEVA